MDNNEETPTKDNKESEEEEEILSIPPEEIDDLNETEKKEKIMCDFIIKQVIGEGTFATVRLAINKQTGEQVAIKIMEKSKIVQEEDKIRIDREIKVLKNLRHPNIVHLYSVIQTEEKIYLIMEYVKGKELFDYIVMKKKLSESESCLFFQQIISGIEYLHKIKYVHRDIKPENLLINEETKELKIVDFGLSNIYTNPTKHLLSSACGSPSYAAPEMLNGEKYKASPVDIWSSGIVLYAMICGYLPFEDEDNDALYDKICKGKFVIPNHVSENGRDLLNKILVTDPKKRLSIYQIKHHPWFSLYNDKGKLMVSDGLILTKYVEPIDEEVVSSMAKTYNIIEEKIRISILLNKHNDISTIYYLLLHKKINNKKKTVANIKSDLFKKYCENKSNLFESYNKDINKVIEDRKNGYSYNVQKLTHSKVLSSNFSDIHRKLKINEANSPDKNNKEEMKSNNKNLDSVKRSRYFSPINKGNKLNIINSNREPNKIQKTSEKQKIITKFYTNNNVFKPKKSEPIKEKNNKNQINTPKAKKEISNRNKKIYDKNKNKEKINDIIIEESKRKEKEQKNDEEEKKKQRNLIKYREKKVHYEKKKDKNININNSKKSSNQKCTSQVKNKNDLINSVNRLNKNKNETQRNRVKSAVVDNYTDKKKNVKEKNDLNIKDLKRSANYEFIHNQKAKNKKHVKSKSTCIDEDENKNNLTTRKEKLTKLNTFKTPIKTSINNNNNKLNIKSKIIKPLEKNKTNELTERGEKKNLFNKTGGLPKTNKDILLSEESQKTKKKIKMNIIYEKKEIIPKKSIKNDDKDQLVSFNTNMNESHELYNKILGDPKIRQIKHFSSYNIKPNNKLIKNLNNSNENIIHDKYMLFKQINSPIIEMQNNNYDNNMKDSISKIDENSLLISNKQLNCYEPFDLNLAYLKPRKVLKEELLDLLDKNKIKYRNNGNTRYIIELKKEDISLGIKFDKLNYIKDEIEENDNNVRISIIKFRRLKGGYENDIKSFEKIIFKLS